MSHVHLSSFCLNCVLGTSVFHNYSLSLMESQTNVGVHEVSRGLHRNEAARWLPVEYGGGAGKKAKGPDSDRFVWRKFRACPNGSGYRPLGHALDSATTKRSKSANSVRRHIEMSP